MFLSLLDGLKPTVSHSGGCVTVSVLMALTAAAILLYFSVYRPHAERVTLMFAIVAWSLDTWLGTLSSILAASSQLSSSASMRLGLLLILPHVELAKTVLIMVQGAYVLFVATIRLCVK